MDKLDLIAAAQALPEAWRSRIVGTSGQARIKVLRMDATSYAEEMHDYNEALCVIDGRLELAVGEARVALHAGELFMIEAHMPHAVCNGSYGTLLIVDSVSPR